MKCKLGDYIRIKHGFAFKGEYITAENNGVVLVTPGNFEIGGGFKEDKCKFFNGDYPKEYVLSPYDLIVTMTDLSKQGDTLGYSALVPKTNRVYLHNQRIGLVDVYGNVILSYANNYEEACNMIEYFKKQGYVFINYSKSNYNYSPYAKYEEDFDTHHVIGQEFDNVCAILQVR